MSALREIGVGSLYHLTLFGSKPKITGVIYATFRHPFYVGVLLLYVGMGLTTGRLGYLLAAGFYATGFLLLGFVEQSLQHPKHSKQ